MNGLGERDLVLLHSQSQPHYTVTREKPMKLAGRKCEMNRRESVLKYRIISPWNSMPQEMTEEKFKGILRGLSYLYWQVNFCAYMKLGQERKGL